MVFILATLNNILAVYHCYIPVICISKELWNRKLSINQWTPLDNYVIFNDVWSVPTEMRFRCSGGIRFLFILVIVASFLGNSPSNLYCIKGHCQNWLAH
jgi:hypothetical protein